MLPSTRADALAAGASAYFTGKPCKRGHVATLTIRQGCVECRKLSAREYAARRRSSNPEAHRDAVKRYRERHPDRIEERVRRWRDENREYVKTYRREHYLANADELRAKSKDWYYANKKLALKRRKEWLKRKPYKIAEANNRRRAKKRNAAGSFTYSDVIAMKKWQGGRCWYCGTKRRKLTIDHRVALSKGGTNYPSNLQLVCKSCNSRKRDRDPIEFANSMGRLF